jgi:hypothetical protein
MPRWPWAPSIDYPHVPRRTSPFRPRLLLLRQWRPGLLVSSSFQLGFRLHSRRRVMERFVNESSALQNAIQCPLLTPHDVLFPRILLLKVEDRLVTLHKSFNPESVYRCMMLVHEINCILHCYRFLFWFFFVNRIGLNCARYYFPRLLDDRAGLGYLIVIAHDVMRSFLAPSTEIMK